jgi:hypothetical protein
MNRVNHIDGWEARMRSFLGATLTLGAMLVVPAGAQTTLEGRVVSGVRGSAVARAEVLVEEIKLSGQTDKSGHFRIAGIPIGVYTVRVTRAGFQTGVMPLRVEGSGNAEVEIRLPEVAAGRDRQLQPRRSASGASGRVVTRDELRPYDGRSLDELLRTLGVRIALTGGGRPYAAGSRGGTAAPACAMRVVLDGILQVGDGGLDQLSVAALDRVEIQNGTFNVGAAFDGISAACGAVLLWSRSRDGRS